MQSFVKYIQNKRNQYNSPITKLIEATYMLETFAQVGEQVSDETIAIEWGTLSALSEKAQSEVFKAFSESINKLAAVGAITKDQVWKLWKQFNPSVTDVDFEEFVAGMLDMGIFQVLVKSSYEEVLDAAGATNVD